MWFHSISITVTIYIYCTHTELVWKVARYTSAAPFYFRPEDQYMDGGLLAPNPSLHALTTIQDHLRRIDSDVGVSLVVSVGAGINRISDYSKIKMNISNIVVPGMSIPVLRFFGHVVSYAKYCFCYVILIVKLAL